MVTLNRLNEIMQKIADFLPYNPSLRFDEDNYSYTLIFCISESEIEDMLKKLYEKDILHAIINNIEYVFSACHWHINDAQFLPTPDISLHNIFEENLKVYPDIQTEMDHKIVYSIGKNQGKDLVATGVLEDVSSVVELYAKFSKIPPQKVPSNLFKLNNDKNLRLKKGKAQLNLVAFIPQLVFLKEWAASNDFSFMVLKETTKKMYVHIIMPTLSPQYFPFAPGSSNQINNRSFLYHDNGLLAKEEECLEQMDEFRSIADIEMYWFPDEEDEIMWEDDDENEEDDDEDD